jgi:hypothetical protein
MAETSWHVFDDGNTLGQKGSENGVTIRDEEYPLGARITLERGCASAPFAITCGIYGWMVHTRFFSLESEACLQYDLMRSALSALLDRASESVDESGKVLMDGAGAFVEMYP